MSLETRLRALATRIATEVKTKANLDHGHAVTDLSATGRTSANFLRGDNTWSHPKPFLARVATTANITLSGTQTIDGVALAVGDFVLVRGQTAPEANGVYVVQSGAWTRHPDFASSIDITGSLVRVGYGTVNAGKTYHLRFSGSKTLETDHIQPDTLSPYEPGDIKPSGRHTASPGWLLCDGTAKDIVDYPDLFAAIGYTYGGTGSYFLVPHLVDGYGPVGAGGSMEYELGNIGGSEEVILSTAQMPAHVHLSGTLTTANAGGHAHTLKLSPSDGSHQGTGRFGAFGDRIDSTTNVVNNDGSHAHGVNGNTASAGENAAVNIMNPYTTVNYFIKT